MRVVSKVFSVIATVLTIAVIITGVLFIVPRLFGIRQYTVLSGSMEPVIKTGAVEFVDTKRKSVAEGDIVAFTEPNGSVVTHRIVGEGSRDGFYVTKGDANEDADFSELDSENIIGKYIFSVPGLGFFLSSFMGRTIKMGNLEIPSGAILVIMVVIGLNIASVALSSAASEEERAVGGNYNADI